MNYSSIPILVQLITESLPISSSSHVALTRMLMNTMGHSIAPWSVSFDHLLHGPMIIVVALFFVRTWFPLVLFFIHGLLLKIGIKKKSSFSMASWHRLCTTLGNLVMYQLLVLVLVSVWYFAIMSQLKKTEWFASTPMLIGGLVITLCSLLSLRYKKKEQYQIFGMREAVILSCVQMGALLPGVSRFASCYVCSRWLGISERRAMQISFLIELPLITGAFLVHGVPILLQGSYVVDAMGFVFMGGIVGALGALWCSNYLARRNLFWLFGFYMILPIMLLVFLSL